MAFTLTTDLKVSGLRLYATGVSLAGDSNSNVVNIEGFHRPSLTGRIASWASAPGGDGRVRVTISNNGTDFDWATQQDSINGNIALHSPDRGSISAGGATSAAATVGRFLQVQWEESAGGSNTVSAGTMDIEVWLPRY